MIGHGIKDSDVCKRVCKMRNLFVSNLGTRTSEIRDPVYSQGLSDISSQSEAPHIPERIRCSRSKCSVLPTSFLSFGTMLVPTNLPLRGNIYTTVAATHNLQNIPRHPAIVIIRNSRGYEPRNEGGEQEAYGRAMIDSHVKPKCIHGSAVGLRKVRCHSSLKEKIPDAMGTKAGKCGKNMRGWEVIWAIDNR